MTKLQYTYGDNTFIVSSKFTPAQKFLLRKLKARCRKELIELGEPVNDDAIFELMTEGDFINGLMAIVYFGQDISMIDFSKIDFSEIFEPINVFFEVVQKKISPKKSSSKK